jgi:6-phosphogluconolactonase
VFTASHNNGHVTALPVLADGSVGKVVADQKTAGTGLHPKQNRPQPHCVAIDPATHRYLLNSDVGADRINIFRFDPATRALTPAKTPFVAVPPGSGARHIAFAPNGKAVYLVTELTAEIRAYSWDASKEDLREIQAFSAYPANYAGPIPASQADIAAVAGSRGGAEIAVSRDGRYVYASVRGDQDSLVVYAIDQGTSKLKEIQRVASGGQSPRSFEFDSTGRWMLVAHEVSSTVVVFRVDPATGKLTATGGSLAIPNAAVFAFYPGK